MFGKPTRYLLVDIIAVEKKKYAVKRESLCLDFVTVYYDKGYLKRYLSSLSQLFNLGKNIDSLAVSFLEEKASKKAKSKSYDQNNINCKG